MATRTEILGLVKPGLEDDADIRVINANMDILDKQIGEVNSVQKHKASWFDSVANMKAEQSLTAGAYVCTAGYYTSNDGGGASYLIREKLETDVDDGGSLHELSNGLVAELIIENGTVNVKQFGAKGDGLSDDTNFIQSSLNSGNKIVFFPAGTYMVETYNESYTNAGGLGKYHPHSKGIRPQSDTTLIFDDNAELKAIKNSSSKYFIVNLNNVNNVTVKNGKILGDRTLEQGEWGYGINITNCDSIIIDGVYIESCLGDGISFNGYEDKWKSTNCVVKNCEINNCRRLGLAIAGADGLIVENCYIHDTKGTLPASAFDIEEDYVSQINNNIIIKNCVLLNNEQASAITSKATNVKIVNNVIDSLVVSRTLTEMPLISHNIITVLLNIGLDWLEVSHCDFVDSIFVGEADNVVFKNCSFKYGDNKYCWLSDNNSKGSADFYNCSFNIKELNAKDAIYARNGLKFRDCSMNIHNESCGISSVLFTSGDLDVENTSIYCNAVPVSRPLTGKTVSVYNSTIRCVGTSEGMLFGVFDADGVIQNSIVSNSYLEDLSSHKQYLFRPYSNAEDKFTVVNCTCKGFSSNLTYSAGGITELVNNTILA